jgi:Zn-dependent protease
MYINALGFIADLALKFVAAVVVVAVYKYSHAYVSSGLGDNLPKFNKTLSFNPMANVDFVGILFFIFTGFGWGKPIETSPRNYKDKKKGTWLVGVSGPIASIILSIVACVIFQTLFAQQEKGLIKTYNVAVLYAVQFFKYIYIFAFNFALVSLLPMFPYDGFMIWGNRISSRAQYQLFQYQAYFLTIFLLIVLIAPQILTAPIELIRNILVLYPVSGVVNL